MSQILTPSAAPTGSRVLLCARRKPTLAEAIIVEWSPLCRVRIRWRSGAESWHEQEQFDLVEVLPAATTAPMAQGDGW